MKKSSLKIATWNVNSLRVRLPYVLAWLQDVKPDVLALQETKLTDADFPFTAIEEAGYSVVASGQKTYNGVAILSKSNMIDITTSIPNLEDAQRRLLAVTIDDVRILNLYVPNGESVVSEKYQYKLHWLKHLNLYLEQEAKRYSKLILLGDFNIAPDDIDVYDSTLFTGQVLFSEQERTAFRDILNLEFIDCFRSLNPQVKSFSWWDYRLNAFKRDMGVRIDHILANYSLAPNCVNCYIDKAPRAGERPSDHVPVIAEFQLQ